MVQLLASVLYLGKEASEGALGLLSWRVLRLPEWDEELPFFAMALLLLYAALFQSDQEGRDLDLLDDTFRKTHNSRHNNSGVEKSVSTPRIDGRVTPESLPLGRPRLSWRS